MKNNRNKSIKRIMMLVFIGAMLVSIGGIGCMVFANWFSSAGKTTEGIAESISRNIYNQIVSFMHVPDHINDVNHRMIKNGILDLSDEKRRDKFFVGVLSAHREEIYSFSYGTAGGEYYGARRNENGVIEIMRNDAGTGGNSWYYSVEEDMTAGDLVVQAGKFDPRTRAWYQAAEKAGGPVLSPVYKHFVMNDLAISAALPIYGENGRLQGVMGAHMLLSEIGAYLHDTVDGYDGYAFIVEHNTGEMIANSMGMDNYSVLEDGTLKRFTIGEMNNADIQQAYENHILNPEPDFSYFGEKEKLFVNIREVHSEGLDWLVITGIPKRLLLSDMFQSIYFAILLALLALALSFLLYKAVMKRLFKPINSLLAVSDALSSGDLSQRVDVMRNDEIGSISNSLNKVADKMTYLIHNLEEIVDDRTKELHKANVLLEDHKNRLQLILDSAAEAIFGMDLEGKCTFCNISCMRLLGYDSPKQLVGENIHQKIHHSRHDGTPFPMDECRIIQSIQEGTGYHADDEVFWRADGTSFDVAYHSYPQVRNEEVAGGVVTFMDITERKKREKEIEYLSYHDILTGLPNRRSFEDSLKREDTPEKLPLSVIFADINGLKMTNDIFGHTAGDELIKKSSEILLNSCREDDVIARVGGDEFILLLPRTNQKNAQKIVSRIRAGFSDAQVSAIRCSISLGSDTKLSMNESLEEVMANAENVMYKDKTMNRKAVHKDIVDTIVETLHSKSAREKRHSNVVGELCAELGVVLNLPETEIGRLERAGYLHDIGKITLDEDLLSRDELTEEEDVKVQQHSLVGYRILNLVDDMLDLAEYVYSHHERWDGKGYPRGLEGEQIPLISRIISVVETYERVLNRGSLPKADRKKAALEEIKKSAGKQFDPQIVDPFVRMMEERDR